MRTNDAGVPTRLPPLAEDALCLGLLAWAGAMVWDVVVNINEQPSTPWTIAIITVIVLLFLIGKVYGR